MKTLWLSEAKLIRPTGLAAVLCFNNWLLGLLLNNNLLIKGGSVSELSVRDQPYHYVFQSLDIASGILFTIVALLVKRQVKKTSLGLNVLIWGTIVFGISNVIDGLLTLPCAETLEKCYIPIHINWSHFNFPSHGYSSVIIATLYFVLPLAGIFYARYINHRLLYFGSLFTVIVASLSLVSAVWQYLDLHSFTVNASGWAQGIQMLVMGSWFILWLQTMKLRLDS